MNQIKQTTITRLKIPFFDIDPLEIVWHGHYAKYFEIARGDLMDQMNYNILEMRQSGYAWPIIDLRIKYLHSATYNQEISIETTLIEYYNRLKIRYIVRDEKTQKKLTKAETIQVAVDLKTKEMCFVSPMILFEKLGVKK